MSLLSLLAACATGPGPLGGGATNDTATGSSCDGEPTVVIGTGENFYRPLEEGDSIPLIYGPQGGWHIWEAVEVQNMGALGSVHFVAEAIEVGGVVSETRNRVGLIPDEDNECMSHFFGIYGYLDVDDLEDGACNTPPEILASTEICIFVDITDEHGDIAEDELCVEAMQWAQDPTGIDAGCGVAD